MNKLYNALTKLGWGYLFIFLDINLGTVSILPAFVGYIKHLQVITMLEDEEKELTLLKPFCKLLFVWNIVLWLTKAIGINIELYFIALIFQIIGLYFHFQLLTNVATVYEKIAFKDNSKINTLRTIYTVTQTILLVLTRIYTFFTQIEWFVFVLLLINAIFTLYLTSKIFSIRNHL